MALPQPDDQTSANAGATGKQLGDTTFTKVFVGGLAWETQSDTMRLYFQQFGEIVEAVVITDKNTGRSKGYGFVTFREAESARRACADATPIIDGRRANCNLASLGLAARPRSPFLQGTLFRPSSIPIPTSLPTPTYNNWPAPTHSHPGAFVYQQPFLAYPPVCHYGYPSYSIDYTCPQVGYPHSTPCAQPLPAYSSVRPSYGVQGAHLQYGTAGARVSASVISTAPQQYRPEGLQAIPTIANSSGLVLAQPAAVTLGLIHVPTQSFAPPPPAHAPQLFSVGQTEQAVN
ncbi:hypothetical protein O6H91_02G131500 [Diphasiastrum complanatum]|uniref:Uncharacterized protein n=1 Tax=Diphasiastrum complanatum TaxID=34168 RepID=A0ACC2EKD6_DIPCM|nr:hypothetical protein O6H91_02G131500 [Diphasiastrum complanatum]